MYHHSSKWIAAAASIIIQSSCGASYTFGIYSPLLKSTQSYDQSTLEIISVFKDIGCNAGILSGLLYSSSFVRRRGPWVVHVVGAAQCFLGYFMMWLSVEGVIERPPVPAMCLFMFMATHVQTFYSTANVVTAVRNFPDNSGTIVGIMKGFLGLSGSMLIQIYLALFNGNPSTFLLMLALLPTFTGLSFMCFVQVSPTNNRDDKKHLDGFSVVAIILAAYLLVVILLENLITFPFWARIFTLVVLLLLLTLPLKIAFDAREEELETLTQMPSDVKSQLISENHELEKCDDDGWTSKELELNLLQSICTIDFWLLFIAMICGMGSGMATINNMSQIGQSLGYTTSQINTLVSLWSIWNFLGRFGAGYISDLFLYTKGWARPSFMAFTLVAMTAGHMIIASGGNLYVGSVIVGICYGSQWSLMPTITSEIFGVKHMGTIFNTIGAANPLGTSILSVLVVGYIYDKESSGESNTCYGTHCFMLSFFVLASVSFLGFLVALVLFFRTRTFYRKLF